MTNYLVLAAFTSSPISLAATTRASAFSFTAHLLPPNIRVNIIGISQSWLHAASMKCGELRSMCPAMWAHPSPFVLFPPSCDTNELTNNLKRRARSMYATGKHKLTRQEMCNIKHRTTVTAVSKSDKQLQMPESLLRKSV